MDQRPLPHAAVLALHWQVNVIMPEGFFGGMLAGPVARSGVVERAARFHAAMRGAGVPLIFWVAGDRRRENPLLPRAARPATRRRTWPGTGQCAPSPPPPSRPAASRPGAGDEPAPSDDLAAFVPTPFLRRFRTALALDTAWRRRRAISYLYTGTQRPYGPARKLGRGFSLPRGSEVRTDHRMSARRSNCADAVSAGTGPSLADASEGPG
jgi:hypothetical protein